MLEKRELRIGLLFTLIATAGLFPVAARVAPDPLPAWETLPRYPHQVVSGLEGEIGKRMVLESGSEKIELYIYAIDYVKLPDGSVTTLRYEYQTEDGQHVLSEKSLSDFPLGTVEVTDLAEIKPAGLIEYTDENGVLAAIPEEYLYAKGGELTDFGDGIFVPHGVGRSSGCWRIVLLRCSGDCLVFDPVTGQPEMAGSCTLTFGRCRCTVGLSLCTLKREVGCASTIDCAGRCRGPGCDCVPWP